MAEAPSVCNDAQRGENARKTSFLNYESPASTAELQARMLIMSNQFVDSGLCGSQSTPMPKALIPATSHHTVVGAIER
jgi:hypothetical protein